MEISKKPLRFLLRGLLTVVLVLVGLEIGVRIWGYSEHYLYDPIYQPFPGAEGIPFVHKPNLHDARARGNARINTDQLGLRSLVPGAPCPPKQAAEFRIGIVGDSVTFGEGVERTEDTYCEVLQNLLNQALGTQRVAVFNFGVSAYSVREMEATLRHRMAAVGPDLVIMAIIPPDFDLSRTPVVDKWGYTFNRRLSGFMPRNSLLKRLLRDLRLVYLARDLRLRWRNRGRDQTPLDFGELPASYAYVREFAARAPAQGIAYRILLLPTLAGHRFGVIKQQLDRDGIHYWDLTALAEQFSADSYMASKFDRHPSARVHRAIARNLTKRILPLIQKP